MGLFSWDPLGVMGEPQGTGTWLAGLLGGPLGFLGGLIGGQVEGGGTSGQSSPQSSGMSILQQIMPVLIIGLLVWAAFKFGPRLLKG